MATGRRPHMSIRGPAGLQVAIWKNAGKYGDYFTHTLTRSFKRDGSTEYEHTSSLRTKDLPLAAVLLNRAFELVAIEESGNLNKPVHVDQASEANADAGQAEADPFSSGNPEPQEKDNIAF